MSESAAACERIRKHLDAGAPWDACDVFREEVAKHLDDADLLYWGALAYARAGAASEAHAVLDRAQSAASAASDRLADSLSLRGRLWKDRLHRASNAADVAALAERARDAYLAAYALQRDPYPGINAASLALLSGDPAASRALAQEVLTRLGTQTSSWTPWDHATAGEAELLLGRFDRAHARYADAYALAPDDAGSVATMRRQLNLLARALPQSRDLLPILRAADVVAFSGHMLDAPDRAVPRFPSALVPAVDAAIRAHLAQLHTPIVYCSAACGSDLILIEAALAIGAEVNVVLPFDRADFVRTSVIGGGDDWVRRFDAALGQVARVIAATDESHLGDDVLFEHAALLVEGLAQLRAAQLETSPALLCVLDPAQPGRVGGARASFERWRQCVGEPRLIDLAELHARHISAASPTAMPPAPGESPSSPSVDGSHRTLKTLLFADVAGYSRLPDALVPLFQDRFWTVAAREIVALPKRPLLANTWGDALYLVFESPRDGADFAVRLLEAMAEHDWKAVGLGGTSRIRIALHAGPVFRGFDPVMGRDNYFGAAVTRAARIEPVTPPGTIYASEAFAASLAATGQDDYALEYTGRLQLAKHYGESRIYRLERR